MAVFCYLGRWSDACSGSVVGSIDVVFHNCLVRLDGDVFKRMKEVAA